MASAPSMASMKMRGGRPTRDQMKAFLEGGTAMMKSTATRELLKDPAISKPGNHLKEMQRANWDPQGIDRDIGCKALDEIGGSDKELAELQMEFMHTSMRVYLRSLEDRKPPELNRSKMMDRETIVEFFDSCNVKMQLPEVQKMLFEEAKNIKGPPREGIINLQREQLEILGIEADHGCQKLSEIGEKFPDDQDLHAKFQQWATIATKIGQQIMQMVMAEEIANNPEQAKMIEKVQEDLQKMTPEERGELLMKMQKKVETIKNLPPEQQQKYVNGLDQAAKQDLMKAQMLMQSMAMQQRMQQQQQQAQASNSASGASDPLLVNTSAKAPSQQQMM